MLHTSCLVSRKSENAFYQVRFDFSERVVSDFPPDYAVPVSWDDYELSWPYNYDVAL